MNRGLLLVIEGIDGAGKTTQANALASRLIRAGIDTLVTKEPTDGKFGTLIRSRSRRGESVSPQQELEWFVQDRAEHVEGVIEPAMARGTTVICDRYFLSTVAYQGALGIDPESILRESEARFPSPDIAFWLAIDPEAGLRRVRARGNGLDPVFEDISRLRRAAEVFGSIDRSYLVRIDGSQSISGVTAEMVRRLSSLAAFEHVRDALVAAP